MQSVRASTVLAALTLASATTARAQLGPDPATVPDVSVEAGLRAAAGPRARFHRVGGRIRIASGMHVAVPGATPEERASRFLARFGAAFGAGPAVELRAERVQRAHGLTFVRFRRHALGSPVLLRSVIVRSRGDGSIDAVFAAPGPAAIDRSPTTVSVEQVGADAATRVPAWRGARAVSAREVGLDLGGAVVRGFVVELEGLHLHQRGLLVYDRRGTLLAGVPRAAHALGRVYDPNPVVAMESTTDVELEHLTSAERLTGRYVRVSACGRGGSRCLPIQTAVAGEDGNFLFDPEEPVHDDEFAEVSGYFHADRAAAYFRETHGFTWSCCGGSTVMEIVVNYSDTPGTPYDNAAYSPSSCSRDSCGTIVLGQGARRDFSYDGDVVTHEYTHSVVDETAGIVGFDLDDLGVSYEPLGINEGTADYFAATVAGDPRVAEYFAGTGGLIAGTSGSLREIDGPTRCPESLFGEGHLDGRVWSGVLWTVREALGADEADMLAYATLLSMADNTGFDDAAELLVGTATSLHDMGILDAADVAAVEAAVADKGLEGCRRIVPLDDLEAHDGYSGAQFATGSVGGSVAPLHYSLEVPADATKVTLHLDKLTLAGRYTVVLRNDQPLRFVASRRPPLLHDTVLEAEGDVEISDAEHPLPRCGTLYLALVAEDLNTRGESAYRLRASIDRSGDPDAACPGGEGDAGADGGGAGGPDGSTGRRAGLTLGGGGGCGCAVAGLPAAGPGGALLIVLVLVVGWRRGRRGSI